MDGYLTRTTFLTATAAMLLTPLGTRAADAKTKYRMRARMERDSDAHVEHKLEAVAEDGKTVTATDGFWNYDTTPRTLHGLKIDFTPTGHPSSDSVIDVKLEGVYTGAKAQSAGNQMKSMLTSKFSAEDTFVPGREHIYPIDVGGTKYNIIITVDPLPAS